MDATVQTIIEAALQQGIWGDCRYYFRFKTDVLPPIDSSCYITKATFSMMADNDPSYPTRSVPITLHEITSEWSADGLRVSNAPNVMPQVTDYAFMAAGAYNARYGCENGMQEHITA